MPETALEAAKDWLSVTIEARKSIKKYNEAILVDSAETIKKIAEGIINDHVINDAVIRDLRAEVDILQQKVEHLRCTERETRSIEHTLRVINQFYMVEKLRDKNIKGVNRK